MEFVELKWIERFLVQFIVTKQEHATLILGINIIEDLVKEYPNLEVLNPIVNSVFPDLNEAKTEAFGNLIQDHLNDPDFISEIKTFENLTIQYSL